MWANVRHVHKLIWVIRLGFFSDSPWADVGEAFQLMRKISLHMRKHPFLRYKKDYAHVSEWKGPGTFLHWSGTRSFSLGIMRMRKPNTPAVRGVTTCIASHGTRWDTGFCLSLWGFATLCPVVSSQLQCFLVVRTAAGAGRSWISSWERKKKPNLKELFSS